MKENQNFGDSKGTNQRALLYWDMSVDKNSLSVGSTDQTRPQDIQTVDRQRLAWQHVSRLQSGFAGVSAEPSADEGLVPTGGGHRTAGHHASVSAT